MMKDYDVIVVGAGNGGLAAAAYLTRKDLKVLVLERHNIPGGCATSFRRGRFEFEVALHQLCGLGTPESPGPLSGHLGRLGVLDKLEFFYMKDIYNFQYAPENLSVMLPPDMNEISALLQGLYPEEKEGIKKYIDLSIKVAHGIICVQYLNDPESSREKYPEYFKYALKTTQDVLDEFLVNPVLKSMLTAYWGYFGLPPHLLNFGALAICYQAYCDFKPAHIKGGSQALSNALAEGILDKGGTIRYNCGVKNIILKNNSVQGVVTDGGEEITSRFVVSNASKVATYHELLPPEQMPGHIRKELRRNTPAASGFLLYLGLDAEPEALGFTETTNFVMGSPDSYTAHNRMRTVDINRDDSFGVSCYSVIDQSFSPKGTSMLQALALKYAEPWYKITPAQYVDTKYRCAEQMLTALKPFYPDLQQHIEEIEIGTPVTLTRYLGSIGGSFLGFERYLKDSEQFCQNESGLSGLYNVGAWYVLPGFQTTLEGGIRTGASILTEMNS
jgi:prolycopene isomerase